MEVIILDSAQAVARLGAARVAELVHKKPAAVLGLATGSTPIALYRQLIRLCGEKQLSFAGVTTFNLDEYLGLAADSPQSYRSFMQRELFDAIDIDQTRTHLPGCAEGENPRRAGARYEAAIRRAGGIDLQILGIGRNGHIGFNEPCSSLASRTRVKTLTPSTVRDNGRLFQAHEFQPRLAMTMGIATILESRRVILLATGGHKAEAVCAAVEGPLSAVCQASALQLHERATFILDEAAAAGLKNRQYFQWAETENRPLIERFGNFYELDTEESDRQ